VENVVPKAKFTVSLESLSETDPPMLVTRPEFMRRMKDMSALSGGAGMFGNFPDMHNLVVNTNHPLAGKVVAETDETKKQQLVKQATDLALLAQGLLKGEELTNFIKRNVELIG
jgi:molecular chaperone HtpG